ncbi:hypothetical protein RFI_39581, partial [Reticulomyxa filosa]
KKKKKKKIVINNNLLVLPLALLNSFYDRELNAYFNGGVADTKGVWYRGTPLWSTVHHNGNEKLGLKSAVMFWVGSAHNCSGRGYPDWYMPYDESYPFTQRIDKIIDLMNTKQYQLLMLYFEEPDSTGHGYGPFSTQTANAVQMMDGYIGYLLSEMDKYNLSETTDVLLLSDHGMAGVSDTQLIEMNTTVFNPFDTAQDDFYIASYSPLFCFYLKHLNESYNITVNYWINRFVSSL